MKFIPYLPFDGDCREAFEFYARVLDGEILAMISHGETPVAGHFGPEHDETIINAHLVAEGAELMGADMPPETGSAKPQGFSVSVQLEDEDRAERIFNALADGGTIYMPFGPSFWARKFGMVTDRYGTPWMINCGRVDF